MKEYSINNTSRRDFIKKTAVGIGAITILPSNLIAGLGTPLPSDKLNIAAIGVGGVGYRNLNNLKTENIVALCDVDWNYGQKAFRRWPNATQYRDFRVMLDNEKNIDAVVIATPDHIHAITAMAAMQLQKHVFVQSPIAGSIFELRRMVETAKVFDVSTQVGNQVTSSDFTRDISETIWAGAIGEIRDVYVWTSEPSWLQGVELPVRRTNTPRELDWDLFVGPSSFIPYNPTFTPYGWRAWWNFGTGALGAVGPHLLEPVFRALKLKAPSSAEASSSDVSLNYAPKAEKILFEFNKRANLPKVAMPVAKIHWYDGGLMPDLPDNLPHGIALKDFRSGILFIGSEGMIIANPLTEHFQIAKGGEIISFETEKVIHRISNSSLGHEADWVRSCKEPTANRLLCSASFESQEALSETILVGTIAVRLQSLRRKLIWDSGQLKFSNIDATEEFEIYTPKNYVVENGLTSMVGSSQKYKVAHFVDQVIRPIYREGWKQI